MRSGRKLGRQRLWMPFAFLKASFCTSPTVLDSTGENLLLLD
jgi:hypothetical protein